MKKFLTLLLLLSLSAVHAQIPQVIDRMIEKYPSAYHRVWYYYDAKHGKEYYRTQFQSARGDVLPSDIATLRNAYLAQWDKTDFGAATGTQYRSPDSLSLTIRDTNVYSFDLGPNELQTDWGKEVKSKKKAKKLTFTALEQQFSSLSNRFQSKAEKVSYTGFPQGVLFVFHRGKGRGVTSGIRTTFYGVPRGEYETLRAIIRTYIGEPVPVTVFDRTWMAMVKSESTPEFYAVGYDPATKTLNFLRATVEDEICIPYDWQTINKLPK